MRSSSLRIFCFLLLISLAHAEAYYNLPASSVKDHIYVEKIAVQTNATGDFSGLTGAIYGELLGIAYVNGNFSGVGTITISSSLPSGLTIDSYNLSSGNAMRAPGLQILTSTDAWARIPLIGPLVVSLSGAQHWGAGSMYIIYR